MTIATEVHQHYMDEWNGILTIPSGFTDRVLSVQEEVPRR